MPDTTVTERIIHKNTVNSFDVFLSPEDDNKLWQNRLSYLLLKRYNKTSMSNA
jgi:hypothetical protein